MLLCGAMLCGCGEGLEVKTDLAEGESLAMLVPMEPPISYRDDGSALAAYCEDGFYSVRHYATQFHSDYTTQSNGKDETGLSTVSIRFQFREYTDADGTSHTMQQRIAEYGVMRLAVTDAELEILQVSPTFSLVVEGRNAFWDEMTYDRVTNEITGTHQAVLDETPKQHLTRWTYWTAICGIVMTGFCAGLFSHPHAWRKKNPVLWLLSAIPAGGMGYWLYVWDFSSYYAWDKSTIGILTDAAVLILWGIASCILWTIWAVKIEEQSK